MSVYQSQKKARGCLYKRRAHLEEINLPFKLNIAAVISSVLLYGGATNAHCITGKFERAHKLYKRWLELSGGFHWKLCAMFAKRNGALALMQSVRFPAREPADLLMQRYLCFWRAHKTANRPAETC